MPHLSADSSRPCLRTVLALATLLAALLLPSRLAAAVVFLDAAEGIIASPEGKHLLRWEIHDAEPTAAAAFELQYSATGDFSEPVTRYRGRDTATSITGLVEGDHHYRVRLVDGETTGEWSKPFTIRVQYVGRGLVVTLMSVGLFLFAATVAAVVKGHQEFRESAA